MISIKDQYLRLDDIDRDTLPQLNYENHPFANILSSESKWSRMNELSKEIKSTSNFDHLVLVGIGGSTQGVKSLAQMCVPELLFNQHLVVIDNLDSHSLNLKLNPLVGKKVFWVVCSKSGSTSETIVLWQSCIDFAKKNNIGLAENCLVMTEEKESPLRAWSKKAKSYYLPSTPDLDGRFSVVSPTSLISLDLLGVKTNEILSGAINALDDSQLLNEISVHLLAAMADSSVSCLWTYDERLREFGEWLVQLWSESLGKPGGNFFASTPILCRGSNSQHSVLQQIEEGPKDKNHVFIVSSEDSNEKITEIFTSSFDFLNGHSLSALQVRMAESTHKSLINGNQSSLFIELKDHSLRSGGYLHGFFHSVIAMMGESLEVPIYGQPGVEKSKTLFKNSFQ